MTYIQSHSSFLELIFCPCVLLALSKVCFFFFFLPDYKLVAQSSLDCRVPCSHQEWEWGEGSLGEICLSQTSNKKCWNTFYWVKLKLCVQLLTFQCGQENVRIWLSSANKELPWNLNHNSRIIEEVIFGMKTKIPLPNHIIQYISVENAVGFEGLD